jgi:LmbE family N-acetylglucosaminyl deacetylase
MLMKFNLIPPTETTTISAHRVLVLAPHFDDEVFGCGGLLAQLSESDAEIKVLYLTDSSGGQEITENRAAYSARRRAEAQRGLDLLGITQLEVLAIPDGTLAASTEAAAETIERVIREHRPDLLLSVSPSEVTADHRAAFAALHRALSTVRGHADLKGILNSCRILLYEVNHPGYPDLLVDVGPQLEVLTAAIDAHASQLELHNYREAALGMRHFRALSLPAEVTAAESYREIHPIDLVTHSHSALVRRLGGIPDLVEVHDGPSVSVIVRTKDRPELLAEALESISHSTFRRVEVVLVNDGGEAPEVPVVFPFPFVRVEMGANQGRAAAANAGVDAATGD